MVLSVSLGAVPSSVEFVLLVVRTWGDPECFLARHGDNTVANHHWLS